MQLFHVSERLLTPGDTIPPGRWGALINHHGVQHPFFFREMMLENWRVQNTDISVSRFNCAYGFESEAVANEYRQANEHVYLVEAQSDSAAHARLDMLWLTWMGEPGVREDQKLFWCASYWAGHATNDLSPTATSTWEHLFACPLEVLRPL